MARDCGSQHVEPVADRRADYTLRTKKIVWRYQHPERKFPFYASAAVARDRVVVGGRDKLVHCLDAATGKSLWTFATKARIDGSPAIAGGRVYAGSGDGTLYVIDLADGSRRGAFEAGAPISASPAIAGGRLVVGTQDGRIYCLG
jgi:outer membrane protein assembly factor BamB